MAQRTKIGLVGAGKLGRALMKVIIPKPEYEYIIYDKRREKARQLAEELGCRVVSEEEIVEESDFLFLALPPIVILPFVTEHEKKMKENGTIINLSTSVDTVQIKHRLKRKDIEAIGIKPVCQATAMLEGRKGVFLSSSKSERLNHIKAMLSNVGIVIEEEEMKVQKINEYATLRALELIIQLKKDLEQIGVSNEIQKSAIGTVAAGTLMDFPYKQENTNDYIANITNKYKLKLY